MMTTFLLTLVAWTLVSCLIYITRKWQTRMTFRSLCYRMPLIIGVNFIFAPYCIFKNVCYFYNRYKRFFVHKPVHKPEVKFVPSHAS